MENRQVVELTKLNAAKDVDGLLWVIKAMKSPKALGTPVSWVCIDKGKAIATDGHRMHLYTLQTVEIPDGCYSVVKKTTSHIILNRNDDVTFPDYKAVVPKNTTNDPVVLGGKNYWGEYKRLIGRFENGSTLNGDLVRDVVSDGNMWDGHVFDDITPVLFEAMGATRQAVVMPMRA